ncbi:MAG TPA: TrkA C-terminal domain-containing protein, partial [Thermodesulfobacteriota bacterium]|nr:TrkA C-terminal domain-containing protein [Thermodesulfobacteriota bacterium]
LVELEIPNNSAVIGKQVVELDIPQDALIVLLSRDNKFIAPKGATVFEKGDKILVLAERDALNKIRSLIETREQ